MIIYKCWLYDKYTKCPIKLVWETLNKKYAEEFREAQNKRFNQLKQNNIIKITEYENGKSN